MTSSNRDIVVIGASAGGVEAVSQIVAALPADFPGTVFVVIHIAPNARSVLPQILSRRGRLPARHPDDGEAIERGVVYVAPPDHHLMVERGTVRIVRGPAENGTRPAVDPLFRSAASAYGPRVIGVVLSGNLDDGTAGLLAIKQRGGVAIVQDPDDALFPGMPQSAVEHVDVDSVLPLNAIPQRILTANAEEVSTPSGAGAAILQQEVRVAESDTPGTASLDPTSTPPGEPSGFTCPNCHGALWELDDGGFLRYRCRVGHAFSPETLVAMDSAAVDEALWVAYRTLEESAALARSMEARSTRRKHHLSAQRFREQAEELDARAAIIRSVLQSAITLSAVEPGSMVGPE